MADIDAIVRELRAARAEWKRTSRNWMAYADLCAKHMPAILDALEAQGKELRECAAFMYQYAGATDAPVEVLDNLGDLANGEPKRHANWPYPAGSKKFDTLLAENVQLRGSPQPDPLVAEVARRDGK